MVPNKSYRQSIAAAFTLSLLFLLMAFARPALAQSAEPTAKVKAPKLSFSPGKLNFGDENVGVTSPSQTVTVSDHSLTSTPVLIRSIVVSSPFVIVGGTCASSIPADGQCTVDVAFKPTATGKVKKKKGLTFTDSAQKSPQHVVELLGQGVAGATPTPTASATATRTATPTATRTSRPTRRRLQQPRRRGAPCRLRPRRLADCHRDENHATATGSGSATPTPTPGPQAGDVLIAGGDTGALLTRLRGLIGDSLHQRCGDLRGRVQHLRYRR